MTALKYHLATYGCQMNEYDSQLIAKMLEDHGYHSASEAEFADVVIVNTCSVRGKAEETAYARIAQLKPLKEKKPSMRIAVVGCMAKNHGDRIPETLRHVDLVLGPDSYGRLTELLQKPQSRKATAVIDTDFDSLENYLGQSAKSSLAHSAYLTIQRGCNKKCTYCIVPFVRGPEKYREPTDIIREAKEALARGVVELTLLGQTVNSYRFGTLDFADLAEKIADLPGLERLRFTSPHPRHFTPHLIELLKNHPRVCRHAHLPLQSGSDSVLRRMRRQYTLSEYSEIVEQLRRGNEYFSITTDLIAGFVGESEHDFLQTLDAVKNLRFDAAFMFAYSPREGTTAFPLEETLSEEEKQTRLQRLIDLQNNITRERNSALVGKVETILVDGPSFRDSREWVGKTSSFKKVVLPEDSPVQTGQSVPVHITEMRGWTLRGKCIL